MNIVNIVKWYNVTFFDFFHHLSLLCQSFMDIDTVLSSTAANHQESPENSSKYPPRLINDQFSQRLTRVKEASVPPILILPLLQQSTSKLIN